MRKDVARCVGWGCCKGKIPRTQLTEAPPTISPTGQFPFDLFQLEAEVKVGDTPPPFAEHPQPTAPPSAFLCPGLVLWGLTWVQ